MARRHFAVVPVALALLFPAGAQAAGGADPGVTVDPGSRRVYAIPLMQDRIDGSGTNQRAAATRRSAPASPRRAAARAGRWSRRPTAPARSSPLPTGPADGRRDQPRPLRSRIGAAEDPSGTAVWTVGIGLAVLLIVEWPRFGAAPGGLSRPPAESQAACHHRISSGLQTLHGPPRPPNNADRSRQQANPKAGRWDLGTARRASRRASPSLGLTIWSSKRAWSENSGAGLPTGSPAHKARRVVFRRSRSLLPRVKP